MTKKQTIIRSIIVYLCIIFYIFISIFAVKSMCELQVLKKSTIDISAYNIAFMQIIISLLLSIFLIFFVKKLSVSKTVNDDNIEYTKEENSSEVVIKFDLENIYSICESQKVNGKNKFSLARNITLSIGNISTYIENLSELLEDTNNAEQIDFSEINKNLDSAKNEINNIYDVVNELLLSIEEDIQLHRRLKDFIDIE